MLGYLIVNILVSSVGFLSTFSVCESYFSKILLEFPKSLTRFLPYLLISLKIEVENLDKISIQKIRSHPQTSD